jgi:hypothetical protein
VVSEQIRIIGQELSRVECIFTGTTSRRQQHTSECDGRRAGTTARILKRYTSADTPRPTDGMAVRSTVCISLGTTNLGGASSQDLLARPHLTSKICHSTVSAARREAQTHETVNLISLATVVADPSLVDRWFAVYDRYMRPLGQPIANPIFSVPQNVAVWNMPALSTEEGREQIDKMHASPRVDSSAVSMALGGANVHAAGIEGTYYSLPLDGRVDLMRPLPARPSVPTPERKPSLAGSPPIYAQALPHTAPVHPPARQGSPPIPETWNAQFDSPPRRSGPQYGEMRQGMPENYVNVWDKPLGHQKQRTEDWNVAGSYPTIPDVVKEDKWYAGAADGKPDYSKVETVFPWEKEERQPPSRHFPASDPPPPRANPLPELRLHLPSPPAPQDIRLPLSTAASPTGPQQHRKQMSFHQAMAQYTNAWDIPSIQNYASRLGGPKERKALAKGMQTPALERENMQGILLAEPESKQRNNKHLVPARPHSHAKRGKRSADSTPPETRSEGSRDGDDEETTSGSDKDEEERYPIVRRGAGGSSTRPGHSRTASKMSSTGGSPISTPGQETGPRSAGNGGGKHYTVRSVQTDPVPMQDRVVQTSPEQRMADLATAKRTAGPSSYKFGAVGADHVSQGTASQTDTGLGGLRRKPVRQSSEETITSATYNSPKNNAQTRVPNGSASSSSNEARPKPTSRIFDPSTSIDVSHLAPKSFALHM